MSQPAGMTVATLTPYDRKGKVDAGLAREHAAWLVESGIPTLAPVGTTGEALYLDRDEKERMVRAVVEGAGSRAAVIAGIWALRLEEIAVLHRSAADAGAAAVFLTTPIYYPAEEDAIVRFYEFVRASGPLPVYAYNIPQYSANEISLPALERLASAGTVAGVKDSTGREERLTALLELFRGRLQVFGASDSMALKARRLGADGFISALANIYPGTFLTVWAGDEAGEAAQAAVDRLRSAVKGYGGIAALKHLLACRGFVSHGTRLPFQVLDAMAEKELGRVMAELADPG
jgi:dihydrodipicolinate synthase/N-acetylneuraminate lyase